VPVVYAIFDLLYIDGRSLVELPYSERRAELEQLGLGGRAWRVPAVNVGEGSRLLEATREQGLEGVVAKRLDSRYEPGRRSGAWLKIKNTLRQELVIGGWVPGEGRRSDRIGALLMGYRRGSDFVYAGRVGTGFTERTLDELGRKLVALRRDRSPFAAGVGGIRFPRGTVFVEPRLVAEVEFREWTGDGVMRAPSFKGLREDKSPRDVVLEGAPDSEAAGALEPDTPEALFDDVERLPEGALMVNVEGRQLRITNWDKVLYPATGFTKGELIAYYARIAPAVLPHLRDRPLTLKRYPNGVDAAYFFEKQSPSHRPDWVQTARINEIEYTLAQDKATLVWLANLADIELHTPLFLTGAPEWPTMLAFDLDPGAPAGLVECCEVARVLHGLFEQLGLESLAKTSGSKGLQVYVPLNVEVGFSETKSLAKRIAELLEQRMPELVVSRMTKRLRPARVLVDWSQNDAHKTTVTVYSVRARERPTVSTPVTWDEVKRCVEQRDEAVLTFEVADVLARVADQGDEFAPVLSLRQQPPAANG
jgi:bifunctional non-homologous end joining protein LigD